MDSHAVYMLFLASPMLGETPSPHCIWSSAFFLFGPPQLGDFWLFFLVPCIFLPCGPSRGYYYEGPHAN